MEDLKGTCFDDLEEAARFRILSNHYFDKYTSSWKENENLKKEIERLKEEIKRLKRELLDE